MVVRSVRRYAGPAYPDKDAASREPALLLSAPERWKRNAAAYAALAATSAMLLSSCRAGTDPGVTGITAQPSASMTVSPTYTPLLTPTPTAGTAAVAVPLFEHGYGRGSFGCVSVAPPAFLSEEEAFEVIGEIAAQEGLSFARDDMQLDGIGLPVTNIYDFKKDGVVGEKEGTLLLDGVSADGKAAFEFVSTEDIENWAEKTNMWSSVSSYDFVGSARVLSKNLNGAATGTAVAVFYDPGVEFARIKKMLWNNGYDEKSYQETEQRIKELVKEDLRAQVRDFIAWLKAQGII